MDLLILLSIWATALVIAAAGLRARSAAKAMGDPQSESETFDDRPDRDWAPDVRLSDNTIIGGIKPPATGERIHTPAQAYWAEPANRSDAFGLGASGFESRFGQPRHSMAMDAGDGTTMASAMGKQETNRTRGGRMIPADPSATP
ncbi:MAG: hypothetical protein AAGJ32_03395 [Pseudomonadota bacterium]